MRNVATFILAVSFMGALAVATSTVVKAQYYYPPPPPDYDDDHGGYGGYYYGHPVPYGHHPYGYGYGNPDPNCTYAGCCPPGFTVQGGVCKPYQGPVGPGPGWGYYHWR